AFDRRGLSPFAADLLLETEVLRCRAYQRRVVRENRNRVAFKLRISNGRTIALQFAIFNARNCKISINYSISNASPLLVII
ncbi:hypothetical protein PFISCL1PPCAC_28396, partial [Pristionchus fissidentatus]